MRGSIRLITQICAAAVSVTAATSVWAEDVGFEYGEMAGLFEPTGGRDGYLSFGLLDRAYETYGDWKSGLREDHGFSFLIEDRLINQWGDGAEIYDNELNLIARQEMARTLPGSLSINIWGQFANSIGGRTQGRFQNDLGVLSPLNGGNSGPDTSNQILQMLAMEYTTPDDHWRFQVGKLALRTLVNLNRYANGDSEMFFSPMLGNNPVVPYTALLGLGAFAEYRRDLWRVSALVRAPDTELGLSTDAWSAGNRSYVVEAALTPTISGWGDGVYRLTWSLDEANATFPRMETWSLSADQDIGPRIGAFARFAQADTTFRDFKRRAAVGLQVKKPFDLTHDRFGVGGWWGDPTNPALRQEHGLELFYNAQITPYLQVTPDLQVVFNPARSTASTEVILGLRLRLAL